MTKKLLLILTAFILAVLPFLVGNTISKYSPYVEANSFKTYVIIWAAISTVFASVALVVSKYYAQSFGNLLNGGLWLFLLIGPMVGIIGFAAPPDLTVKVLEHPELEHLRYIFLFIAALLFGAFSLFLFKSNFLKIGNVTRWIAIVIFMLAFAEFMWEFTHHYLYPDALKEWIGSGKSAEAFGKNYENTTIINIGVLGRLIQFSLIILLSIQLYRTRHIKIWSPIITIILGSIGIVSAIVIYVTEMNFPKGFEILFLFFIPGMPFLLLYWLGVGLLTTFKKPEIAV